MPRERVLAEIARRGLDQGGTIFCQNLRHFFTRSVAGSTRRGRRCPTETGIEDCDRLKKQGGESFPRICFLTDFAIP